jgi:nucleoside-diphosphate-sugar epimerase
MQRAESDFDRLENIGSDELVSIDELADMIITISGKTIKKKYDVSAPQGVRGRNADITLTREILGWLPNVTLQEGLTKTFRWITAQCRKVD